MTETNKHVLYWREKYRTFDSINTNKLSTVDTSPYIIEYRLEWWLHKLRRYFMTQPAPKFRGY